ncbi:MAG: hypothetical protein KKG33_00080 [candidate division Zixibacteria bacterium]|nr:hypothetical protein [candidate division Zixibacteria bacterium]MBU1472070.1 hypothetical protein [candidate division Zixibacteria bacterium]MBU2623936.1 hypothetical protein [candidate division Zixibacteria bacterium]
MLTSEEFVKLTKLRWLALCTALITAALVSAEMADAGRKIHSDAAAIVTKSLDSLQQHAEDKSPASGEEIDWKCLSSGGTQSSDGSFVINGTFGQLAVGTSSDGTSDTRHGYWQNFAYKWECGDVNMSGDIDIGVICGSKIDAIFSKTPEDSESALGLTRESVPTCKIIPAHETVGINVNCTGGVLHEEAVILITVCFSSLLLVFAIGQFVLLSDHRARCKYQ